MKRSLQERVRATRQRARLSTRQLDALAGLTPGHVAAIESGRKGDVMGRVLDRLAIALGASMDWLYAGRGKAPSARAVRRAASATPRSQRAA